LHSKPQLLRQRTLDSFRIVKARLSAEAKATNSNTVARSKAVGNDVKRPPTSPSVGFEDGSRSVALTAFGKAEHSGQAKASEAVVRAEKDGLVRAEKDSFGSGVGCCGVSAATCSWRKLCLVVAYLVVGMTVCTT
jgi:hypothetical protein